MSKMRNINLKIGELYCGPGGLGLAASKSKLKLKNNLISMDHAWASDYDYDSCKTYSKNILKNNNLFNYPDLPKKIPSGSVICSDVQKLKKRFNDLPSIDGFTYGFPCNDFSIVGESRGLQGKFGGLYSYGIDILKAFKPKFIFAENVGGLNSSNSGFALKRILTDIANQGYELTVNLYKFEDYGIPQARHRIIIVGIRNDLKKKFKVPKPSYRTVTVKDAFSKPIPKNAFNNELTKQSDRVIERLKHIKPGQNAWNSNLPEHLQLNVPNSRLSHIYKRLDPKKPAYTITGSGGGGTHCYHWLEPRALTNRERARLQTFPDNYKFEGSKESVRKQIGMAVPVKGAKIILESILKTLYSVDYPSVEPTHILDDQLNLL